MISADGRFVAFESLATNLVKNDATGSTRDVFVHDRATGKTRLVSRSSNGSQGTGAGTATRPSISANGRYIAFASGRNGLVPGDADGLVDVFVHDRVRRKTKLVSKSTSGNNGDGGSSSPDISGSGRLVVFASNATNLVGSDTNGRSDIFVRDRKKGTTRRISVRTGGGEPFDGQASNPTISANGRIVAWLDNADDLGGFAPVGVSDVYTRDRKTKKTELVHRSTAGVAGDDDAENAALSADGRTVAFETEADNLVGFPVNDDRNIFVRKPLR